jgi:hypothetical protein
MTACLLPCFLIGQARCLPGCPTPWVLSSCFRRATRRSGFLSTSTHKPCKNRWTRTEGPHKDEEKG